MKAQCPACKNKFLIQPSMIEKTGDPVDDQAVAAAPETAAAPKSFFRSTKFYIFAAAAVLIIGAIAVFLACMTGGDSTEQKGEAPTAQASEKGDAPTAQKGKAIKIDMSTPLTAKKTYTEAINDLTDQEVLEFGLTWWFELNKIIAAKAEKEGKTGLPFSVAIELWHGRTLQERIAFVKEKYRDEFSEKYSREEKKIGKITPELISKYRDGWIKRFGKMIRENQSKDDETRWDNSGKDYFH